MISFSSPSALVIDSSDNIYIADEENHKVRRIDKADSYIYLIAGDGFAGLSTAAYVDGVTGGDEGGPAVQASLYNPSGVSLDGQGNLYIASFYDRMILKVDIEVDLTTSIMDSNCVR